MKSIHHPSLETLEKYVSGEIDDQLAVLIATHIGDCAKCAAQVRKIEERMASQLEETPSVEANLSGMIADIIQLPAAEVSKKSNAPLSLQLQEKSFDLPLPLTKLKSQMAPWKKFNKFTYSKVNVPGPGSMYFLYFENGAEIPDHTHKGNEYVYVVSGSFQDGLSEYSTGDFANFTSSHSHSPKTNDPDGCLLLVSIEAPFHFQKGWAKYLNLFGRWLY